MTHNDISYLITYSFKRVENLSERTNIKMLIYHDKARYHNKFYYWFIKDMSISYVEMWRILSFNLTQKLIQK